MLKILGDCLGSCWDANDVCIETYSGEVQKMRKVTMTVFSKKEVPEYYMRSAEKDMHRDGKATMCTG